MGFATVDRQTDAEVTAVWVTSRTGTNVVRNTNAVVIQHDDPDYIRTVRALTTRHSVVLTEGSAPPLPFAHAVRIDMFDELLDATARLQADIGEAIAAYSPTQESKIGCAQVPSGSQAGGRRA